ncbi:MAG: hypothetical protein M0R73_02555 [Dehalococcoidia bacterium]|nr:hypothetical protein [Dehalococcoidia bacterium]
MELSLLLMALGVLVAVMVAAEAFGFMRSFDILAPLVTLLAGVLARALGKVFPSRDAPRDPPDGTPPTTPTGGAHRG